MPFKDQEKGLPIWEPPSPEEVKKFDESLLSLEGNNSDFIQSAQDHLNFFLRETLLGAQRLASSNTNMLKGFTNLASKGFGAIDIIIPVYGHLQVLKPCIDSVLRRTNWPFKLTLVDDCSDAGTTTWLERFEKETDHQVLYNKKNRGFAATVNRGILATNNPYICILNSDVIVTDNWITKMLLALESNPRNKIVNPVTNNTAEIAVPMQAGYSYRAMNKGLEATSSHRYPEIMPTGFCFLIPRSLIDDIGLFDEGYGSYGEETDFWMRTITYLAEGEYLRWRSVLADDTYIFHERGTSFSSFGDGEHFAKRKKGNSRFKTIWPFYGDWRRNFDLDASMNPVRVKMSRDVLNNKENKYNIAFIVHSASFCGGMKYIADIINTLNENNVDAKLVLVKRNPQETPNVLGELRSAPVIFNNVADALKGFGEEVFEKGHVVAATNELIPIVHAVCQNFPNLKSVLFSQSADPMIAANEETKKAFEKSYGMVDNIITASNWLQTYIQKLGYKTIGSIGPGVDTNLFYPRNRKTGDDRPTLLIALDDRYPYRGTDRGVKVANFVSRIARRNKIDIRILAYGAISVKGHPEITCLGRISQSQMANILGKEVDVFLDPSYIHSYGLPVLEAIASGVTPVCWNNLGVNEYAVDGKNAFIFPKNTPENIVANKCYSLLVGDEFLKNKTNFVVPNREESVRQFIDTLEKGLDLYNPKRKISVVTPHLRKHGGPTTILNLANSLKEDGHDVDLYVVYPDLNPELVDLANIPIRLNWNQVNPCDVLITNSDGDKNSHFVSQPQASKKILLKLSHNPRFQKLEDDSLKMPWDAIITSSEWLKEACEKPMEGWTHPSREATRVGWYHYGHPEFACDFKNKPKSPVITVGTLIHQHPLKGTNHALDALQNVKERNKENKIHIAGIGEWPQFAEKCPPTIQYLQSLNRKQMVDAMRQTNIWVTASLSEGLGRMALEAMSASCAVIMTDTEAEFARHKENCIIVPKGDSNAIEEALQELIDDPALLQSIAEEGFKTAQEMGNPRDYISNVNKVIQGLF